MSDPSGVLWMIPALPLLASIVTAAFGPRLLKQHSHWPCIVGAGLACVLSILVMIGVAGGFHGHVEYATWFDIPADADVVTQFPLHVGLSLQVDGLTAVMLLAVTFVGTLIAIYSVGYMHGDAGYARFFAEISLFLFAMTGLVLANNFIVLYAFWEGVGLCSYLLIGFWFQRPSAAAAARKAFLVTRLGDIGLFLGILILWAATGSLDYDKIFMPDEPISSGILTAACLLLFLGAVGKSAQFPLHVWLPDAMEGPSPVSALIHAATMVTAGVYLVARCTPLFALAPTAQLVVACIGGFTALLAALIALTQNDLKRVLAYSTVSQLGYMFLALGSGLATEHLVAVGVAAAIFHLFTHAFFKALLFLGAGSVMHAMGDIIDMRRFSGLRHVLKTTHWTFLCGAGALSGFPIIFSGFWSKDEILATTFGASHGESFAAVYAILFVTSLVTAALTAFYTARAYFLTFWGEVKLPPEAGHHPHESTIMLVPLQILAVGAVGIGLTLGPTHLFAHFLEQHWLETSTATRRFLSAEGHGMNVLLMAGSSLFALAGIGLAYWMYVRKPAVADEIATSVQGPYELSRNKFYLDELYEAFMVQPLTNLAQALRILDQYIVDGLVDLLGQVPRFLGYLFRPIQNGLVQFYALLMALGLAGFLLSVLLR